MNKKRTGDEFVKMLAALASPPRIRILAALAERHAYVSELARSLGISRPLLHMHLQALEKAGLVVGHHEISAEGKALRYYEVADFDERLTPKRLSEAAASLSLENKPERKTKESI